jgi:hypothetical protein
VVDRLGDEAVKEVPIEHMTELMVIAPHDEPHEAERREQRLVRAFLRHLDDLGHDVCRLQFRPRDEPAPIFCDLYDKTDHTLRGQGLGRARRFGWRLANSPITRATLTPNPKG